MAIEPTAEDLKRAEEFWGKREPVTDRPKTLNDFMSPRGAATPMAPPVGENDPEVQAQVPVVEAPPATIPAEVPAEPVNEVVIPEPIAPQISPVVSVEDADDEDIKKVDGMWQISVTSESGQVEIFRGKTKNEVIKALAKGKKHATEKIAQQQRIIETQNEVLIEPEHVELPSLLEVKQLTPEERFKISQMLTDPARVAEAYKLLKESDPDEVERKNQEILARINQEGNDITQAWVATTGFNASRRNIRELATFMKKQGWSITAKNLDAAVDYLIKTDRLVNPFGDELELPEPPVVASPQPAAPAAVAQPAVAAPAVPPVAPAGPPSVLPDADRERNLRPGSSSTGGTRSDMVARPAAPASSAPATPKIVLTAEEYRRTPMSEVRRRYRTEPAYRAAVDELLNIKA